MAASGDLVAEAMLEGQVSICKVSTCTSRDLMAQNLISVQPTCFSYFLFHFLERFVT